MDFYLSPAGKEHLPQIQKLAQQPSTSDTDAELLRYALEAVRLSGFVASREVTVSDTIQEDDGKRVSVHAGDRVVITSVRSLPRLNHTIRISSANNFPDTRHLRPRARRPEPLGGQLPLPRSWVLVALWP